MNLIDFWTLGHLLAAFFLAGIFVLSNKKFNQSFIFATSALLFWEIYEFYILIPESNLNRIGDLVIGLIFFSISYFFFQKNEKKILKIKFTNHNSFFDMWSLDHLLIYGLVGVVLFELGVDLLSGLIFSTIIMVLWEMYERKIGIKESYLNSIFDVVFGIIGFLAFFSISSKFSFNFGLATSIIVLETLLMLKIWSNRIK